VKQSDGKVAVSPALLEQARKMRAIKPPVGWERIGRTLKCSSHTLRCLLDQSYRKIGAPPSERRRERKLQAAKPSTPQRQICDHAVKDSARSQIPAAVLIERERSRELAQNARSITAILLGDPLPGRSALDEKKELLKRRV
jgi:hypothetical protein